MSDRRIRFMAWAVAALLTSAAAPAAAQPAKGGAGASSQAAPSAKELYTQAQKLFDKGNFTEALGAFRQAYSASNSPNARIMIGHCLVALGRLGEAYEELAETMRESAKRAETEPKYAPTRDAAATQVAQLETKVGKVIVEVPDRTGALVTLNGARVDPDKLGLPIAVDPGTAVVAATRSDGRTARREQVVKAGTTERVTLSFTEAGGAAASGPVQGAEVGPEPPGGAGAKDKGGEVTKRGGGVRTAGFVIAGLGVAGMAVFAVTGTMAKSRFTTLEEECGGARCTDPKYGDVIDSGMTLTTVANVGLIAGAACLASGGLMILLGGPSSAPQSSASVTVSPGGAGIHYKLAF
jgi:hypothetical protein